MNTLTKHNQLEDTESRKNLLQIHCNKLFHKDYYSHFLKTTIHYSLRNI